MDSVKGNMEEMKDKIDHLTRVITNMIDREVRDAKRKVSSASTPPPVDGNPLQGFICNIQRGEAKNNTPRPEGYIPTIIHGGASCPIQILVPQDNYMILSQQYNDKDHRVRTQKIKLVGLPTVTIGETRDEDKYKILE